MEREIQTQNAKLQQHFTLKLNTLQNLNNQLNAKLQQYGDIHGDFNNLKEEYNNSL